MPTAAGPSSELSMIRTPASRPALPGWAAFVMASSSAARRLPDRVLASADDAPEQRTGASTPSRACTSHPFGLRSAPARGALDATAGNRSDLDPSAGKLSVAADLHRRYGRDTDLLQRARRGDPRAPIRGNRRDA